MQRMRYLAAILAVIFLSAFGTGAEQKPPRIYKDRVTPHWFAGNTKFWYQNELPGGAKQYIVVDAAKGARERTDSPPAIVPTEENADRSKEQSESERRRRRAEYGPSDKSPDGKWSVSTRNHNVLLKSLEDGKEIKLTHDGSEGLSYGHWSWSPDAARLVAFRIEPGETKEVYLIESSPAEGGRAKLKSRTYALPGDKFTRYEVNIFEIASQKQFKAEVER